MTTIITPITEVLLPQLNVGENITISGYIYTGRDAVLPKIVNLIKLRQLKEYGIYLEGSVIFHTAAVLQG